MQPDDTTPVTTVAHPAQQSDLARLHLDCLIAMPWNKLYRAHTPGSLPLTRLIPLAKICSLCWIIWLCWGAASRISATLCWKAPDLLRLQPHRHPFTKYHANYCEVCPSILPAERRLHRCCCPPQDMLPLHRAELQVLAEGAADILRRDPDAMPAAAPKPAPRCKAMAEKPAGYNAP